MKKSILTVSFSSIISILLVVGVGCTNNPPLESIVPSSSYTQPLISTSTPASHHLPNVISDLPPTTSLLVPSSSQSNTSPSLPPQLSTPPSVQEFLMGYSKDREVFPPSGNYGSNVDAMEKYRENNGIPINFNNYDNHCTATTTPDEFEFNYCLGQDLYTFQDQSTTTNGIEMITHDLLLNGQKVATGLCGDVDFIQDTRKVNSQLAFTFWQNCHFDSSDHFAAVSNIYYNGEIFNQKYGVQGTHYLFAYQGKLGFVIKKNNKEYIFFNNKIISPAYDQILTYGCCMNPHYLEVFKNGKVDFMAVKDEKDYLVEIDLKKYLP